MTIRELLEKYYFHDTLVTSIEYNSEEQRLVMMLDFCNWMQPDFVKGMKENIPAELSFYRVPSYSSPLGEIDYYSILRCIYLDSNRLCIALLDDYHEQLYELNIVADAVEFKILPELLNCKPVRYTHENPSPVPAGF